MTLATAYRNKIDALWLDFHSGGITNPITVIEQISYLMFARLLDITEGDAKGDIYEHLLGKLSTAGIAGQFRSPRHIIAAVRNPICHEPKILWDREEDAADDFTGSTPAHPSQCLDALKKSV